MKRKLKLLLVFLNGSKRFFFVSILTTVAAALFDMINPQIIRTAIDSITGAEIKASFVSKFLSDKAGGFENIAENMWMPALAVLICALLKVLTQYLSRVYNTKFSETLVKTMRDTLFAHIARLPYSWHMKNRTGDIIQRCTSDIDTLKYFISEQLISIFRIASMLILSVMFMLSMDWHLTVIAVIPMPVMILYSYFFHNKIGEQFRKCDEAEGHLSATVQENLTGVRVVRAFGREKYERDRFIAQNRDYTALWIKLAGTLSGFWCVSDIISGIQVMLLLVFGSVFCVKGQVSSGELVAFISYNSMLVWPIRQLGRMISELSKAEVSIDRIMQITEENEETDTPCSICPDMSGDIVFDGVSFGYEGCPEILHDISFTVKGGTTLGILGNTGSGKSTLGLLLDKLYLLDKGKITVSGVDIKDIKTSYLRSNIGLVLQEPYLFSRTIAENIKIAKPDAGMEEVKAAAKAACLDETVSAFADGYETAVGERGVTLSGGQKQRTAIARALIQNTPILIFDDSMSAVDTETDAKIRTELRKRFGNASIIIVSHRISTLSKTDNIIVLDSGRIAESGTHEELVKLGGIYSRVSAAQQKNTGEVCPL